MTPIQLRCGNHERGLPQLGSLRRSPQPTTVRLLPPRARALTADVRLDQQQLSDVLRGPKIHQGPSGWIFPAARRSWILRSSGRTSTATTASPAGSGLCSAGLGPWAGGRGDRVVRHVRGIARMGRTPPGGGSCSTETASRSSRCPSASRRPYGCRVLRAPVCPLPMHGPFARPRLDVRADELAPEHLASAAICFAALDAALAMMALGAVFMSVGFGLDHRFAYQASLAVLMVLAFAAGRWPRACIGAADPRPARGLAVACRRGVGLCGLPRVARAPLRGERLRLGLRLRSRRRPRDRLPPGDHLAAPGSRCRRRGLRRRWRRSYGTACEAALPRVF